MVSIIRISDGTVLGYTESPVYIRLADNGCYVPCPYDTATGISYKSTPYHLAGRDPLKKCEDVVISKIDIGDIFHMNEATAKEMENAICDADIVNASRMADIENAMCEQDGKENA